jgi:hypothetical protein
MQNVPPFAAIARNTGADAGVLQEAQMYKNFYMASATSYQ